MKKLIFIAFVFSCLSAVAQTFTNNDSALNTGLAASESCALSSSSCTNPFITHSGTNIWREFANPWAVTSATSGTTTVNYTGSGAWNVTVNYTGLTTVSGVNGSPLLRYGGDVFNTTPILGQGNLVFPVRVNDMSSLVVDLTYTLTNTSAPANQDVGFDEWLIPTSTYSGGNSGAFEIFIAPYFNFAGACNGGGATFIGTFSYNVNNSPVVWNEYSWGSGAGNEQIFCPSGTQYSTGSLRFDMLPMIKQAVADAGGATVTNGWYLANMDLATEFGGSAALNYSLAVTRLDIEQSFPIASALPLFWFQPKAVVGANTWTLRHFDAAAATTGTAHAVTVTSTVAHDTLVAGLEVESGTVSAITISAVTAGACNVAWAHVPNSNVFSGSSRSADLYYCTDAIGSITSITVTSAGGTCGSCVAMIWQATPSTGSSVLDTGATPAGTRIDTTTNPAAGVALSLSSNNHFVVAIAAASGTMSSFGAGNNCSSDAIGTPNGGMGAVHCLDNQTSATYPVTWSMSATSVVMNAVAFK